RHARTIGPRGVVSDLDKDVAIDRPAVAHRPQQLVLVVVLAPDPVQQRGRDVGEGRVDVELDALGEGEVGKEVAEGRDVVRGDLWLSGRTPIRPVMAKIKGRRVGVTSQSRTVNLELLICEFYESKRADGDR